MRNREYEKVKRATRFRPSGHGRRYSVVAGLVVMLALALPCLFLIPLAYAPATRSEDTLRFVWNLVPALLSLGPQVAWTLCAGGWREKGGAAFCVAMLFGPAVIVLYMALALLTLFAASLFSSGGAR
jgi:hypothetical protein